MSLLSCSEYTQDFPKQWQDHVGNTIITARGLLHCCTTFHIILRQLFNITNFQMPHRLNGEIVKTWVFFFIAQSEFDEDFEQGT